MKLRSLRPNPFIETGPTNEGPFELTGKDFINALGEVWDINVTVLGHYSQNLEGQTVTIDPRIESLVMKNNDHTVSFFFITDKDNGQINGIYRIEGFDEYIQLGPRPYYVILNNRDETFVRFDDNQPKFHLDRNIGLPILLMNTLVAL